MDTSNRKTETINEGFTTYETASHSSKVLGTYNAQTVTVMEERKLDSYPRRRWFPMG